MRRRWSGDRPGSGDLRWAYDGAAMDEVSDLFEDDWGGFTIPGDEEEEDGVDADSCCRRWGGRLVGCGKQARTPQRARRPPTTDEAVAQQFLEEVMPMADDRRREAVGADLATVMRDSPIGTTVDEAFGELQRRASVAERGGGATAGRAARGQHDVELCRAHMAHKSRSVWRTLVNPAMGSTQPAIVPYGEDAGRVAVPVSTVDVEATADDRAWAASLGVRTCTRKKDDDGHQVLIASHQ